MSYDLASLATLTGAILKGDPHCEVDHVDTLVDSKAGAVSFLSNKKYIKFLSETKASLVVLSAEYAEQCPTNMLISDSPYLDYVKINRLLNPTPEIKPNTHSSSVIASSAELAPSVCIKSGVVVGENTIIEANVVIGENAVIGNQVSIASGSQILANVTICDGTVIGERCLIHPGVVLGSDGFGLAKDGDAWLKIPQLGNVILGDDVEIGANSTIDRGALKDTVIADGVKLDNLVHVAHNVTIGENTAIAAQTGIAGSSEIGSQCTLGGQVGVIGHLKITEDVHVSAMTGIVRDVTESGQYTGLMPTMKHRDWQKNAVRIRQLDKLAKQVQQLEKQLSFLKETD